MENKAITRDELADQHGGYTYDHGQKVASFKAGFDAAELKYQHLIEALLFYSSDDYGCGCCTLDKMLSEDNGEKARQALILLDPNFEKIIEQRNKYDL